MASQETLIADVQNGIDLLNRRGPAGWQWLINTDHLHIESSVDCPLGQVYGNFTAGLDALPEIDNQMFGFGFTGQEHLPIWKAEIRKLQTIDVPDLVTA